MACYGCTSKFRFFNKEIACAACGFGFCSKCLKQKCAVPNTNSELNVCKACFIKLTNRNGSKDEIVPPNAFIRRLENLENPSRPPITLYRHDKRIQQLRTGLSKEDQEIADRLEKLRADRKSEPLPSDEEIRQRLSDLRGEKFRTNSDKSSKMALQPDLRSDQQKVDSLIDQYISEAGIDLATKSASEIEPKLLHYQQVAKQLSSEELDDSSSETSSDEADKLALRIMEEVVIEKAETARHPHSLQSTDRGTPLHASTPELGYCRICYSRATKRCIDCEGDLYCLKCFTEIHRDWNETHHKWIEYEQIPRLSEEEDDDDEDDENELENELKDEEKHSRSSKNAL